MAKVTPGGMDAEIEISEMRYGEPFERNALLVISCRAVALTIRSASVAGSIRSMTVLTPRRARPTASRAPWPAPDRLLLMRSVVVGSLAVRVAAVAATSTLLLAASAASWARLMKLTLAPPSCRRVPPSYRRTARA